MKTLLRTAGAALTGLLVILLVANAYLMLARNDGTAFEPKARAIAAAMFFAAFGAYALSVVISGKGFGVIRDSISVVLLFAAGLVLGANLLTATAYAPVKRTMADLRAIGLAVDAYAIDHLAYPNAKSLDELAQKLQPYMRDMPRVDGWGFPLRYETGGTAQKPAYFIGSPGKHGKWEHSTLAQYSNRKNTSSDEDILFSNGNFVTYR